MSDFEVPEPILNSPYDEPKAYWKIVHGETPEKLSGRRPARYYYKPPGKQPVSAGVEDVGTEIELKLVNRIRKALGQWRADGMPGVTGTTLNLINYWRRDGRRHRLFFAQLEAVETIIFLREARADYLQGIQIPVDEPGEESKAQGYSAFTRYACKMATGSGKTTVMGMLAAWSILNSVHTRQRGTYSDIVLIVCPNTIIRKRLEELDPHLGESSLYRTRDLVQRELMSDLGQGRVIITNWHNFEPQTSQVGGVTARVARTGTAVRTNETIIIGEKSTNARGKRYLTIEDYERQQAAGLMEVKKEERDDSGNLKRVFIESVRYVQSDSSLVSDVLGSESGRNILVMNDEAHHAYRIKPVTAADEFDDDDDDELEDELAKEANVWMSGLDKIHSKRTINFCVDLSATPYFLARVGRETNRPFPWVVSDFGLTDAIESGLVKIPQLAVRDTTGKEIPGYFNIWRWILPQLTPSERGGKKESPKPEAILKYANTPVMMLAGLWDEVRREWEKVKDDPRPPVFILVCKNTKIARVMYEWLAENKPPYGIPPSGIAAFRNTDGQVNTIRADTKVILETESDQSKSDEDAWMRFTLNTVGRTEWPSDRVGRPIYPDGFEELAKKMGRPLHPPGRDVRCIVSVSMLTEGWDCNTVTHIIGLRPFMSQLLCEQVVGRGLRRINYEVGENGLLTEETAKIFGVPFEVIPFKQNKTGPQPPPVQRKHLHAIPGKERYRIVFPRVEGYRQAIRNRITVDPHVAPLQLDPTRIPSEVDMKALIPSLSGRPSLLGPGRVERVTMNPYRKGKRFQELVFELAKDLMLAHSMQSDVQLPAHVLYPQLLKIVDWYLREKVEPLGEAEVIDVFLSPYYGLVLERLSLAIQPDLASGEQPEVPRYEVNRGPGSTSEVDFWTSRDVREIERSHLNFVVADTKVWEQSAAYQIDKHPRVDAFVKNAGLGFAIPYTHNGQTHDYIPDFIVRLTGSKPLHLILETKGYDELKHVKEQAAQRWVAAVNADGKFGEWRYTMVGKVEDIPDRLHYFHASDG